ncbi:unnamed protein product [Spodoptera exigua]|nr:unnamed protein product [Spodoptera exigua]
MICIFYLDICTFLLTIFIMILYIECGTHDKIIMSINIT